jgi:DNA invertase Pin-like site-specific DNA recombinase
MRGAKLTGDSDIETIVISKRGGGLIRLNCPSQGEHIEGTDFQEILKEAGVAFVSIGEQWDTTTPMGEFALLLFLGVAQLERQQISARIREKAEWRAQKGLKNGGQTLGYDIDPDNPGVPTVNEAEKQLVRLIFETYVKVKGLRRTAEEINRKGYRSKSYVSRRGKSCGATCSTI